MNHKRLALAISVFLACLPGVASAANLPVTSGLQLWLAGDSINTSSTSQVTPQNAAWGTYFVKNWVDQSGNGYTASQPAIAKEPVLYSGNRNGHGILCFTGSCSLASNMPQISGDKSIFLVEARIDNAPRSEISSSSSTGGMFLANFGGGESVGRASGIYDAVVPGQINDWIVKSVVRQGSSLTLMVNGVSTTVTAPDAAAGNYLIGNTFAGLMAEIIVYNRAVSEQERQAIEDYLCEKYLLWTSTLQDRNGLNLWLTTEAIQGGTGYTAPQVRYSGTSAYLSSWCDRSLFGYGAWMYSFACQPSFINNVLNGRPMVRFNGGSQFMTSNVPQIAGDKSIFVMHRPAGSGGVELASNSGSSGMYLASSGTNEAKGRLYVAQDLSVASGSNQYVVKDFIRHSGTETLLVNGAGNSAVVPDSAAGNYTLSFNSWAFQGDIGEILMYNRALPDAERISVENYLFNKWSYPPNNILSVTPDLQVPATTNGAPAPGQRVRQTTPAYAGTAAYHTLYLPTDWKPGVKYPVIVEYPPNGPFSDTYGDATTGNVEDCAMGYGLSGGQGYIWISMPTLGGSPLANQTLWWGNMATTEDYCLQTVKYVCQNYGGDPSAVILAGFSRGGIACNYVGLYDSTIADTWLAFMPHSGYDGQETDWGYPYADAGSALARLNLLNGRAQYITWDTEQASPLGYLASTGINLSALTLRTLPYINHTAIWTEDPIQLRRSARAWLQQVVSQKPGTYSISGTVTNVHGVPMAGVVVQSGATHFTTTDGNGNYVLGGLIPSARTVTAAVPNYPGYVFPPSNVTVSGSNITGVNFQSVQ